MLEKETLLRFARSLADLRIEVKQLCCCTTKACITSEPGSSHKFSGPHDAPLAHDGLLRKPDILICTNIRFFASGSSHRRVNSGPRSLLRRFIRTFVTSKTAES